MSDHPQDPAVEGQEDQQGQQADPAAARPAQDGSAGAPNAGRGSPGEEEAGGIFDEDDLGDASGASSIEQGSDSSN